MVVKREEKQGAYTESECECISDPETYDLALME